MRHFMLVNNAGKPLDITTQEILFHDIGGLGFDEDNDFRHIGEVWWLNHTSYNQATISGSIMFTENGDTDPYVKYRNFIEFISKPPLTLLYNPLGPITKATILGDDEDDNTVYYRTVRVSKLGKSEKDEYGVIDENIDFIAYTPWYQKKIEKLIPKESSGEEEDITGWIWGGPVDEDLYSLAIDDEVDGQGNPVPQLITFPQDYGESDPLVFEPEGATLDIPDYATEVTEENPNPRSTAVVPAFEGNATPAKFREESLSDITLPPLNSAVKSPAKLTIYGPISRPEWTHSVRRGDTSVIVGTGRFTEDVLLSQGEYIVIDNTGGQYQMYKHNSNGTDTDLYSIRDFSTSCFITLREGENQISVVSGGPGGGEPAKHVEVEGHMYYATV